MADPEILYVVAAVVALGLVAWVLVVLLRPATGKGASVKSPPGPALSDHASRAGGLGKHPSDRPKLDSHSEIRDEPGAKLAREGRAREAEDEDTG